MMMIFIAIGLVLAIATWGIDRFIRSRNRQEFAEHLCTTLIGALLGFGLVVFMHAYFEQREQTREMVSEIGAAYYEVHYNTSVIDKLIDSWRFGPIHQDQDIELMPDITFGTFKILFEKGLTYTKITSRQFKWELSRKYALSKRIEAQFNEIGTEYSKERLLSLRVLKYEAISLVDFLDEEAKNIRPGQWSDIKEGIERRELRRPFAR